MVNTEKVTAFITALSNKFENKQTNKKSDISGDFTTDTVSYPTVQAVKSFVSNTLGNYVQKSNTSGLLKSDGSVDTNSYLTSASISGKEDVNNKVSAWSETTTDTHYPSEKLVKSALDNKVSKSSTSGLLKNDGSVDTNTYLTSANITGKENTSNKVSTWSSTTTNTHYPSEKLVKDSLDDKISKSSTVGLVKNDGTVDTTTYLSSHQDISGKENTSNKVSSWSDTLTDVSYPSEKLVKNSLDDKISKSSTVGLVKNDGSIDTNTYLTSHQNISGKENTSNKVTSWSSTTTDIHYPSEKLVKSSLDDKIDKSSTSGLVKNDGSIDTSTYLTSADLSGYQTTSNLVTSFSSTTSNTKYPSEKLVKTELDKKIATSSTVGLVKNDGSIDTTSYLTSSSITGKENTSNKVTSWSSTTTDAHYPSEKLVKDSLDNKISKSSTTGLVKNDGSIDTNTYLTSHQSLSDIGGAVSVEKVTSGIGDNIARYNIKQGGSTVTNGTIDIPKDFLVKSGQVKTVTTANSPVDGYVVGDKYLDFVINSKDGSATDNHMYVLVSDLVEDTTYSADNSTLQLSSGTFSIKNGGVGSNQIATSVKNSWLTTSDVDSEIEDYLDAITTALNS